MNETLKFHKYRKDYSEKCSLSILICTIPERSAYLSRLYNELIAQIVSADANFEIIILNSDRSVLIGTKRNMLLQEAIGDYVCFFDDDDMPSPHYVKLLKEAITKGKDCCSLKGQITWNGQNPEIFEHSLKFKEWATTNNKDPKYERPPNHLNAIKSSIAKQFLFPEKNHGEDADWSLAIKNSGLLITEENVPEVIYNYLYISNK